MHPSLNEIKEALFDLGHNVTNMWNIKQRGTKKPLPIFVVELKQNENNKLTYETKTLLHCRISFEPPRFKREILQCAKCQQYGHTKAYCRRNPRCIKRAGNHLSTKCARKNRTTMSNVYFEMCTRKKVFLTTEISNRKSIETVINQQMQDKSIKPAYTQAIQNIGNQSIHNYANVTNFKENSEWSELKDMLNQIIQ